MCAVEPATRIERGEASHARRLRPLRLGLMVLFAIGLHAFAWRTLPPDMREVIIPWYQHILDAGPLGAFAQPFSNYTPPYLYLLTLASALDPILPPFHVIKLLSVVGTAFLALAFGALLKALDPGRSAWGGAWVFLLPSAVINAAYLGQCDALWTGACLLAVAAMIRGASVPALLWCGVAIAFKAQAAFIAPFIIGSLVGTRVPFWQWTIPGMVYCAAMLPAWVAGWPAQDLAMVYIRQAGELTFAGNLANPWIWARHFAGKLATPFYPIGYGAAMLASIAIAALAAGSVGKRRAMLCLAILSAMALPWLLPKMHERYFFLADVLALALAVGFRDRAALVIAIAVQCVSLMALFSYVTDWRVPAMAGAVVAGMVLVETFNQARRFGAQGPAWIGLRRPRDNRIEAAI